MCKFQIIVIFVVTSIMTTNLVVNAQDAGEQLITQQWASPSDEAMLDAAIVAPGVSPDSLAAGKTKVALVALNGTVYHGEPSADTPGLFSFAGVSAGIYTVTVQGPEVVACYAVHLVDSQGAGVEPRHADWRAVGVQETQVRPESEARRRHQATQSAD